MLCDKIDYDTNNVYTWKQRHLWSGISQSSAGIRKNVSFSDTETEYWDDTLASFDSEPSPDCPSTSGQQDRFTPNPPKNADTDNARGARTTTKIQKDMPWAEEEMGT